MSLPERQYIRPKEAPEAFGISRFTLYRWAELGHIQIYKRGGVSLASIREVSDYIDGTASAQTGGITKGGAA